MLAELVERCKNIGIELICSSSLTNYLVNTESTDIYGARAIRRRITTEVENKLSSLIVEKKLNEGDSVQVFCENGEIFFEILQKKAVSVSYAY